MIILLLAKLCRVFVNVNIALVFVPSNQWTSLLLCTQNEGLPSLSALLSTFADTYLSFLLYALFVHFHRFTRALSFLQYKNCPFWSPDNWCASVPYLHSLLLIFPFRFLLISWVFDFPASVLFPSSYLVWKQILVSAFALFCSLLKEKKVEFFSITISSFIIGSCLNPIIKAFPKWVFRFLEKNTFMFSWQEKSVLFLDQGVWFWGERF